MIFSDKDLAAASAEVIDLIAPPLPCPVEAPVEENDPLLKKIMGKIRVRTVLRLITRSAAAVLLLLLVSTAALLTFSTEARAAVASWSRSVYENSIVYRFFAQPEDKELPEYDLTWIPEGFRLKEETATDTVYSAFYENKATGEAFVFEYRLLKGNGETYLIEPSADLTAESVWINGAKAELITSETGGGFNLIWIDSGNMTAFNLDANLGRADLVRIAESIVKR